MKARFPIASRFSLSVSYASMALMFTAPLVRAVTAYTNTSAGSWPTAANWSASIPTNGQRISVNAGTTLTSTSGVGYASDTLFIGAITTDPRALVVGSAAGVPSSPNTLVVNGAYTHAGTHTAEINGHTPGTHHDQINVTGKVDITGGSLTTLFTGTYSGFAQGAVVSSDGGFDWQISYLANSGGSPTFTGGNDIALMAVPEPNVASLLGGLGLLALIRRRR